MADIEKTVEIIFSGVDNASKTFASVTTSLENFSGKIQSGAQPLADLASGVLKAEAALAALAAGGLAYAYAKSIQFEAATIELQKVIGDEADQLNLAQAAALELSDAYGVASSNVLQSTAAFKQAGFSVEEAMQLTRNALDLVIAGDIEAAEASEILIAALKGFNAPASEAARLIDVLNEVSNQYATDVEQLGAGMAALAPIANQMGFSFEETAGILTPVIEVFRSGDEAANALKTGLLKLVDDSKPVKDALAQIGVSQTDVNGKLRSGKDILMDVAQAFTGLEANEKSYITQQLVGINQAARMVTVFDNLSTSTEITAAAMAAAGSAASEVQARLASGEVAVERFKVGFQNLAIAVGDQFRDAATGAVNGATDIETALSKLAAGGAFDAVLGVVENLATDMGDLFKGIAEAMPEALEQVDWSGFTDSLEGVVSEVGDLFDAFFGDIDLTTPEGLAAAIQKIIDAGTALNNVVSGLLDAWEPFVRKLGEAIDAFSQGDADVQEFVGTILGFGQALNKLSGIAGEVSSALSGIASAFSGLLALKLTGMVTDTGALGKNLGALGAVGKVAVPVTISIVGAKILSEIVYSLIPGLKELDQKTFRATIDLGGNLYDFLIGDAVKQVGDWGEDVGNLIADAIEAIFDVQEAHAMEIPVALDTGPIERDLNSLDWSDWDDMGPTVIPKLDMDQLERDLASLDWSDWMDMAPAITPQIVSAGMDPDAFKNIEDFADQIEHELEDVGVVDVDADDTSIEDTKRKIQQSFKNATMAPVGLEFDGTGVGPALEDELNKHFSDNPMKMDEIFDPGSLSDLFAALEGSDSVRNRTMIEQAINEQMRVQRDLANIQKAAAQQMWDAAYMTQMTAEQDGTIQIEAAGLEPEMEAFMWKLLKKIQVRANESGAEFLLAAAS